MALKRWVRRRTAAVPPEATNGGWGRSESSPTLAKAPSMRRRGRCTSRAKNSSRLARLPATRAREANWGSGGQPWRGAMAAKSQTVSRGDWSSTQAPRPGFRVGAFGPMGPDPMGQTRGQWDKRRQRSLRSASACWRRARGAGRPGLAAAGGRGPTARRMLLRSARAAGLKRSRPSSASRTLPATWVASWRRCCCSSRWASSSCNSSRARAVKPAVLAP